VHLFFKFHIPHGLPFLANVVIS